MREVSIYVKESCDALDSKTGYYIALLSTQGKEKKISKCFPDTTNYKMIIQGAIDAIKLLNQPCHIKLYTHTTFGMSKIRHTNGEWRDNVKGSINTDLLGELKDLIIKGEHQLETFYDKETVDMKINPDMRPDYKQIVLSMNMDLYEKVKDKCDKRGTDIKTFLLTALTKWVEK